LSRSEEKGSKEIATQHPGRLFLKGWFRPPNENKEERGVAKIFAQYRVGEKILGKK